MYKQISLFTAFLFLIFSGIYFIHFYQANQQRIEALRLIDVEHVHFETVEKAIINELPLSKINTRNEVDPLTVESSYAAKAQYTIDYLFDNDIRQNGLLAIGCLIVAVFLLLLPVFHKKQSLIYLSLAMLTGLLLSGSIYWAFPPAVKDQPVFSEKKLSKVKQQTIERHNFSESELYFVPTKFFVRSIERMNSDLVIINGYIVQQYPFQLVPYMEEINFPGAEAVDLLKALEVPAGREMVVEYQFQAYYEKQFDHTYFPFYYNQFEVKLNYADRKGPLVFLPDTKFFDGPYDMVEGTGLEIHIQDHDFEKSFYSMTDQASGQDAELIKAGLPSLQYNVLTKADPWGAILPLTILFLLLALMTRLTFPLHSANALSALTFCIVTLLLTFLDHFMMHNQLYYPYLIPFDGYYFLMYINVILFGLLVYGFSFAKLDHGRLEQFERKVRRLFWPANLTVGYILTVYLLF